MVIYLALNEIFKAPIKVKSVTEFCNIMEKMSSSKSAANTRFLLDEYQVNFTFTTINVTGGNGVTKHSARQLLSFKMFAKSMHFNFWVAKTFNMFWSCIWLPIVLFKLLQKLCAPCKTIDHRTRHKNSKGRLENQFPLGKFWIKFEKDIFFSSYKSFKHCP